jgi:membrane protein
MASLKERVASTVERLRARFGWLDHVLRMLAHYGAVNGNAQAGAITYFGFLSVFPMLVLGAFAIGIVAVVYPDIRAQMTAEISTLLPGLIGTGEGEIDLTTLGDYRGLTGLIGLLGVLYAGLGWLSALRKALEVMFVLPSGDKPNFLSGKLRDLATLVLIGLTLMVSVVLSGAVTSFSGNILQLLGVDPGAEVPTVLLSLLGHLLGIAASTVLLLIMFKLLVVDSHVPRRALVGGAVLGASGFELLKFGANLLLGLTRDNPAFQQFGIALILLVWIYYFSRLVMYSAAWSYTSPLALAKRTAEAMRAPGAALSPDAPVTPEESHAAVEEVVEARGPAQSVPVQERGPVRPVPVQERGPAEQPPRQRPWLLAGLAAAVAGVVAAVIRGVRR